MPPPRLFVDQRLTQGAAISVDGERVHYLRNVMRLRHGHQVRAFNADDGEWLGKLAELERHRAIVELVEQRRKPHLEAGPTLIFAPMKRNRLEWLVEKAVELGVGSFQPVLTEHSVVELSKPQRLLARIIEAAEQCERLSVPVILDPLSLQHVSPSGTMLFADEKGYAVPVYQSLKAELPESLLVGPEGGFSQSERQALRERPNVVPISLGPHILRAETAAIALLSCWRAECDQRLSEQRGDPTW